MMEYPVGHDRHAARGLALMEGSIRGPGRGRLKVVLQVLDPLLRDALVTWLDMVPGYVVAGAVSTGPALTRLCALRSPAVAVIQLDATDTGELALVAELRELRPAPFVIGLHRSVAPARLLRLHRAGAHRFVSSKFGAAALRAALSEARLNRSASKRTTDLSGRELEILTLVSAGCSAADIADVLDISPHTVTNYKRRIFAKLGVHSRTQAAAEAGRLGLRGDEVDHRCRDAVTGRSGSLRDTVAGILSAAGTDERPQVTVLVQPTEACWRAGNQRSNNVVVVEPGGRDLMAEAVLRGADAVLSAERLEERLPMVVSLVKAGYLVAANEVVRGLLRGAHSWPRPRSLTPRERDILGSIALGHSVRETAEALGISVRTVQSEQRQLFAKLGAGNRPGALANARELGLVDT
jgi:DNA-binding NarL/FixJ family response regulator